MNPLPKIPHDDWFDGKPHPHDSMPIAKNDDGSTYASRHESTPDHEKTAEEVVSMHEKMYRMATHKHSPWKGGGSENFQAK